MPGLSAMGFGGGFVQGLSQSLAMKQQRDQQKSDKQQQTAQQALTFLMNSGQLGGIEDIPEPMLGAAFPSLFGEGVKKGKGKPGEVDPPGMVKNLLHHAIQGTQGQPLTPGPAATQPDMTPPPGNVGPEQTTVPSTPFGPAAGSTPPQPRKTLFGVPILSKEDVANRKSQASADLLKRQIVQARVMLPQLQALDPKATVFDALKAMGVDVLNHPDHQFTPVAVGRPLAATDVPADAKDQKGQPIDKTTAPYWQPVRGTTGEMFYEPGAQPTQAGGGGLGTRAGYIKQWALDNNLDPAHLSVADQDKAMKAYVHASSAAGETEEAKQKRGEDIAESIMSGEQPPELTRLAGLSGYVRDSLSKKGYNLTQATQDWMATQKYLSTLNSPAQTRLRQSVEFVKESIPLVQSLSEDLDKVVDKTKYPLLNKGVMLSAKQGILGEDAKNAAVNLDNQINELHTELAVMFKGGGSSTNEALQRADTLLQSNWDTKQLKTALDLLQKNATIRLNSISSIGPSGTSQGNIYAPEGSTTPSPAKAGAGKTAPAAPAGAVIKDGKLYINGTLVGAP